MGSETFLEVILAIILPPVGVFLRFGCGVEFWMFVADNIGIYTWNHICIMCPCRGVLDMFVADNIGIYTRNHNNG
ncbi:hypothetical protein DVH24_023995 [Malus domestica]|uniref:Uncharacterized protein n=1 Tax=Malus domestica TaxID=3750 RepID=A0A498JLX9_MALDO|nr:hypothetical protein DVH24_023995 [Malus domestica]